MLINLLGILLAQLAPGSNYGPSGGDLQLCSQLLCILSQKTFRPPVPYPVGLTAPGYNSPQHASNRVGNVTSTGSGSGNSGKLHFPLTYNKLS